MRSALIISLALLAGCAKVAAPTASGARHAWTVPHVLRIADISDPDHLNPYLSQMDVTYDLTSLVYSYLVIADGNGHLIGDLATAVPSRANGGISRDGRTYTYHLHPGVLWQDGVPFNAGDVIASWRAVVNPRNETLHREGYDRVVAISAPNPLTVVVHLAHRYPPFVTQFFAPLQEGGKPILPGHILARERDFNTGELNRHPIGTGPFRFVSWERGNRIRYVRYDHYFKGRPKLARIEFRVIPNDNTILTEMRLHHLDLIVSPPDAMATEFRSLPGVTTELFPWNAQVGLAFNVRKPGLHDVVVRRAIARAIDYPGLIRSVTNVIAEVAHNTLPPTAIGYERLPAHRYDPRGARAMLSAAGWHRGPDGVRAKNGVRLAFTLASIVGASSIQRLALELQAELRSIGVAIAIKAYPYDTIFALDGPIYGGTYDLAAYSTTVAWDPDVHYYLGCDQWYPHGENIYGYCNPALDRLEAAGLTSDDPRVRARYYGAASRIMWNGAPYLPLFELRRFVVRSPDLRNYDPNPTSTPWWNAWQWDI